VILHIVLLAALASAPCGAFDAQLEKTYGFRPSKLDEAGIDAKSSQMDAVWKVVQQNPGTLGPCLKAALKRPTEDGWFLFDGSQLLVSVDKSREAKLLLLDALGRVALDDVDLRVWVAIASRLGVEGFDTSALGKRWLSYPKAEYFLPEHGAYRVDRENGAMFIFGALDERYATPALVELARSGSGEQKEIATRLLMSQATPEALRALALPEQPALIEPRKPPRTSRAEFVAAFTALLAGDEEPFNRLVTAVPDGERDLVAVMTPADLDMLRKVRRRYIARNTQHAIEYYNQFSQILMTMVWTPPR